jgi:hypothetical protein
MQEQVPILTVIKERGLDLEKVGVILYQQLTSGLVGPLLKFLEQLGHLCWVEVVHSEPLVHS